MLLPRNSSKHWITVLFTAVAYVLTFKYYLGIGGVLDPANTSGSWTPIGANATCASYTHQGVTHNASLSPSKNDAESCLEQLKRKDALMPLQLLMIFILLVLAFEGIRLQAYRIAPREEKPTRGYFGGSTKMSDWAEDIGAVGHIVVLILFYLTNSNVPGKDACTMCRNSPNHLLYAVLLFAIGTLTQLFFNGNSKERPTTFKANHLDNYNMIEFGLAVAGVILVLVGFFKNNDPAETCPNTKKDRVNDFHGIFTLPVTLAHFVFVACFSSTAGRNRNTRKAKFRLLMTAYFAFAVGYLSVNYDALSCAYDDAIKALLMTVLVILFVVNTGFLWEALGLSRSRNQVAVTKQATGAQLRPRSSDMASMRLTTDKGTANNAKSLQFV